MTCIYRILCYMLPANAPRPLSPFINNFVRYISANYINNKVCGINLPDYSVRYSFPSSKDFAPFLSIINATPLSHVLLVLGPE